MTEQILAFTKEEFEKVEELTRQLYPFKLFTGAESALEMLKDTLTQLAVINLLKEMKERVEK